MKIFNGRIPLLGAVILASTLLSGCPSGSSDTNNTGSTPSAVKVTASLGKFSKDTVVNLKKLDGTLLGTGWVLDDGTTNITLPVGYAEPIVVEVLGGADVKYYDEKSNSDVAFPSTKKLRAVMPSVKTAVGVTPLTNAAVAKLEAASASGALAAATMDEIALANTKMAAAFGLSDILLPPTPVDASTVTGKTLNIAKLEDKYALVLAALARTSSSDAAAAADALALDMKDDKLDGMDGTSPLMDYTPANIAAEYQAAAIDFMDATSQATVVANPIVIVADVSAIIPATPDVTLAKAMFAEMRTTLSSLNNATKTGFLDTKATSLNADLAANVGPDMGKVINRTYALGAAAEALKDRNAYTVSNPLGFMTGLATTLDPTNGTQQSLARIKGSVNHVVMFGGEVTYCWSSPSATIPLSTMSCIMAGRGSAVITSSTAGYLKVVQLDITETAANTYTYTATRKNMPVAFDFATSQWQPSGILTLTALPAGSGNYTGTKDASGSFLTGALTGTMPPSTINVAGTAPLTGLDHFNISVVRTALATPANSARFTVVGTVSSANLTDPNKTNATFSFDAGTYIDMEQTTATDYYGQTIDNVIAGKVIGTYQTPATKFTGVIDLGASVKDLYKASGMVTSIIATGTISDISVGGVGEILTGKAEITTTDYALYDSLELDSSTNYVKQSVTFTGTVQQPSRPLMKLVVTKAPTSYQNYAETLNYTYGTVSVTGSRNTNDLTPQNYVLSLSNQDGIAVVITSTPTLTTGVATKSTSNLATFTSATGMISYQDGFTESLM